MTIWIARERPLQRQRRRLIDGASDGARDRLGGGIPDGRRRERGFCIEWTYAGCGRKDHVAVERRMDRMNGERQAILRHDGEVPGLRLREGSIGCRHDERRADPRRAFGAGF